MSYVIERDGDLLACGYYTGIGSGANGVGMMKTADSSFSSFMQLDDVKAPVACEPSSMTAMKCETWWLDWERELMSGQFTAGDGGVAGSGAAGAAGSSVDAGGPDAGAAGTAGAQPVAGSAAGAGGTGATPPPSDGGCAVFAAGRTEQGASFALVLGVLGLAFARRRRSRSVRGR